MFTVRPHDSRARTLSRCGSAIALLMSLVAATQTDAQASQTTAAAPTGVRFIENLGQWPADVRFAADIGGVVARAECEGLGFHAVDAEGRGAYLRLVFEGGISMPEPHGLDPLPGVHHYYIGNDPTRWRSNARAFAQVAYTDIYPGVDLILRSESGSPKYDLVFRPGADIGRVRARWVGQDRATTGGRGLTLGVGGTAVHELPVVAWQVRPDGTHFPAEVYWNTTESGELALRGTDLDSTLGLVVDPEVVWGTYLGSSSSAGGGESSTRVRLDQDGNVVVLGYTREYGFPTTPGAIVIQPQGTRWITVTKLNSVDGRGIYSAVLGGSSNQRETDISVDGLGRVLVVGQTMSTDFPTTAQAYDSVLDTFESAFAFRLSTDGSVLEYSTFLEGSLLGLTAGTSCHANDDGTSLVAGTFGAGPNFPSTMPPLGDVPQDSTAYGSFITKLDGTASGIVWSRLIGNGAALQELAVGGSGDIYAAGVVRSPLFPTTPNSLQPIKPHPTNAVVFALRLSPGCQQVRWSTFLGSAYPSEFTLPYALSVDDFGCPSFLFGTNSNTFPTSLGALQANAPVQPGSFYGGGMTRIAADGSHLVYSTYLTSPGYGGLGAPSVDRSGVVTLAGNIGAYFPTTPGAEDPQDDPGAEFQIARLDPRGQRLLHLRHFGGTSAKIVTASAVHTSRSVTVAGTVQYPGGMPTTLTAFQPNYAGGSSDAFVMTLDLQVAGVTPIGDGTPACHGPIVTEAWRSPAASASDFGLYCSGAPENARGALLIGRAASTPTLFGGAVLHIDRAAGFRALRVRADEYGYLEKTVPVPALPFGTTFTVQFVFQNHRSCVGVGRYSSSNALRLEVQ